MLHKHMSLKHVYEKLNPNFFLEIGIHVPSQFGSFRVDITYLSKSRGSNKNDSNSLGTALFCKTVPGTYKMQGLVTHTPQEIADLPQKFPRARAQITITIMGVRFRFVSKFIGGPDDFAPHHSLRISKNVCDYSRPIGPLGPPRVRDLRGVTLCDTV